MPPMNKTFILIKIGATITFLIEVGGLRWKIVPLSKNGYKTRGIFLRCLKKKVFNFDLAFNNKSRGHGSREGAGQGTGALERGV